MQPPDVERPSFVPRDLLEHPHDFGIEGDAVWNLARTLDEATRLARAIEQHRLALALRRSLRRHGQSIPDLATALHVRREGLWRKLRGEAPATENDLILWAWIVQDPKRQHQPAINVLAADGADIAVPSFPLPQRG